jgi:hypothetical protein
VPAAGFTSRGLNLLRKTVVQSNDAFRLKADYIRAAARPTRVLGPNPAAPLLLPMRGAIAGCPVRRLAYAEVPRTKDNVAERRSTRSRIGPRSNREIAVGQSEVVTEGAVGREFDSRPSTQTVASGWVPP